MPPVKIYETLQQSNNTDAYVMNKDGSDAQRINRDDLDFFKKDDDAISKKESIMNGSMDGKSPQKSLAIKGPPKIISEKLDIGNYQGVKVTDINVRPIQQSVAQIRAQKEMSSINSQRNIDGSLSHHGGSAMNH